MLHYLALALSMQATPPASPAASAQPNPQATSLPGPKATAGNNGKHLGQVKKLRTGNLTASQVKFALTHQTAEAQKLRKMHSVRFEDLRVYRIPANLRKTLHAAAATIAYEPFRSTDAVAQLSGLGSFLNIIANVNVQDALNNTLNNNTVDLSLSDVLNGNNIAIGQVVGVYVDSGGVITTIIK